MLTVPTEIRKSAIHGQGVFALCDIHEGAVVWMFDHMDQRTPHWVMENWEPRLRAYAKQRGYINHKGDLVLCIDEAQFLNFPPIGQKANLRLGGLQDGEYLLIAAENIAAGAELTVPPESDLDYERKVSKG